MEVSAGGGFPAAPPGGLGGVGWGQGVSPKHCPPAPPQRTAERPLQLPLVA